MLLAAGVASALWTGAAALALHERRTMHRPEDEPPAADGPLVSVIVPARNEARGIGAAIRSLRALDYARVEVVVVDDQSDDGTGAAARAAAGDDPRVRVLTGRPLPEGWIGKPWACWQGATAARGEWLLFTDADVLHAPDSLGRTLAMARRLGRGGLTLFPTIDSAGLVERVVTPAALVAIGTFVAPGPLARAPRSGVAIAAGGYMLMPRALYDAVGGHAAIRGHMVDDVTLAARGQAPRRPAAAGARRAPGAAADVPRRPRGVGRLEQERLVRRGRRPRQGARGRRHPRRARRPAGPRRGGRRRAVAIRPWRPRASPGRSRSLALQRLSSWAVPTPARYAPTLPLGLLVLSGAAVRGAVSRIRGTGAQWRGRRYPLAR